MAEKLKKSNHKQQDENIDEPEQKHQKPNECESEAEVIEPKAITNIYYDCLERIFEFLDLKSLLMVAHTCKRLQIAAAAKFGDDFGNKHVWLDIQGINRPSLHFYNQETIAVSGLKFCLPFLRCFGGKISKVVAYYNFRRSKDLHLDEYINQYCADTLTSINFTGKSQFSSQAFQKPFKNVQKVEITACYFMGKLLFDFVNWFPNMRQLELFSCAVEKTASMNVFFPHLVHLCLSTAENNSDDQQNESVMNLVRCNRQLQSLDIQWDFKLPLNTLLDEIHGNSIITTLEATVDMTDVYVDELNRFVVEHPLMVELDLKGYRLAADDAINFIRRMKSLKLIGFQAKNRSECDRIMNAFNNEWKCKVSIDSDGFYVELKR